MRLIACCAILLLARDAVAASLDEVRADLARRVAGLDAQRAAAAPGDGGWLFPRSDLNAYARDVFWGDAAPKAGPTGRDGDPLAGIEDFHGQLAKAGIALVVVPVPGKSAVFGDRLIPPLPSLPAGTRLDAVHVRFHGELARRGVTVIDLLADFQRMRANGVASHGAQDSHWSPAGMELAARKIAALVKSQPWYATAPRVPIALETVTVEAIGDLVAKDEPVAGERFTVRQVKSGDRYVDGLEPDQVTARRASPLLLIGDSHCLVYGQLRLLAEHAGIGSQLAAELGVIPDVVASAANGLAGPRAELARRKDALAGKKCVVWLFAARWLSEGGDGWKPVAIIR